MGICSESNIIEAGNRTVLGHSQAGLLQRTDDTNRHHVIETYNCRREFGQTEEMLRTNHTAIWTTVRSVKNIFIWHSQLRGTHLVAKPFESLLGGAP